MSFPEVQGASSWGGPSHYSNGLNRGRSRRRQQDNDMEKTPTRATMMRSHSADGRPQYGERRDRGMAPNRSCTAMFYPPQESRAVVTPSPLYSPGRYNSPEFALQDFDGMFHDLEILHSASTPEPNTTMSEGGSLYTTPMIRQSRSTDSGGGRHNWPPVQQYQGHPRENRYQSQNQHQNHSYYEPTTNPSQQAYNWGPHEPRAPGPTDYEHLKDSLIMFGDAYADQASVYTGMSQQELLQRKRKDQTSQRRKEKKYGKKKKKDRIVNLTSGLLSSSPGQSIRDRTSSSNTNYNMHNQPLRRSPDRKGGEEYPQQQVNTTMSIAKGGRTGLRSSLIRKRQQARSQTDKSGRGLWNMIPSLSRSRSGSASPPRARISQSSSEDIISSASSRESDLVPIDYESDYDRNIGLTHSNSFDDRPSQRASPVVTRGEIVPTEWGQAALDATSSDDDFEEDMTFEDMTRLEATLAKNIPKQSDFRPKLTSSAAVYARKTRDAEVESVGDGYGVYYNDDSIPQSSRVRFAEHVKTKTVDDPTSPKAEPLNEASPTSVMALNHNINSPMTRDDTEDVERLPQPRRIHHDEAEPQPPLEDHLSPHSSIISEKPKSILRKGRGTRSDTSSTTDWHSEEATDLRKGRSTRSETSSTNDWQSDVTAATTSSRSNKSVRISNNADEPEGSFIAKSPPTTGFVDSEGLELSPIGVVESVNSLADSVVQPGLGRKAPEIHDWQSEGEDTFARNNIPEMYHQPFFEERGRKDDDSGVISEAYSEFITAVASVVLQTAVRRFLAKCRVRKLRHAANDGRLQHGGTKMATQAPENDRVGVERVEQDWGKMAAQFPEDEGKGRLPEAGRYQEKRSMVPASASGSPRRVDNVVSAVQNENMENRRYNLAAVQIQSAFRGWWVRDYIAVDHFCAKIIQKAFRGSRCRFNYNFDLYRIVLVQSVARRNTAQFNYNFDLYRIVMVQSIVRKNIARDVALIRLSSVIAIQATFRGFIVRRSLDLLHDQIMADQAMAENSFYNNAATKIQSQWRSYVCEMAYLRSYEDIVMVQTLVRGWITRRLLLAWLKAHKIILKGLNYERQMRHRQEIAAIVQRQEVEERKKALAPLEREDEQRKHDWSSLASQSDEQRRQGMAALAAQHQSKQRNNLAHLAARQQVRKNPELIKPLSEQDPPTRPKYRVSVEATRQELSTSSKEESVVPYDRAEQLRKERIAYHRDRERASKRGEPTIQSSGIGSQEDPQSNESSQAKEGVSQGNAKENYSSNLTTNGTLEYHARLQMERSGMSSASEITTDRNGTSGGTSPARLAPIRPAKRHNPFQRHRTDEEQNRIDKMHEIFLRVGLMARVATKRVEATPLSNTATARTDQQRTRRDNPYDEGGNEGFHTSAKEASASDLIRAWKGRDQTQPKMQGRLY